MKKSISYFLLSTLLIGCNNNISTTVNSNNSSNFISSSNSSTSTKKEKTFDEMLNELKVDNITYQSDYLIYYYEDEDELITLKDYDVTSKICEDAYDMVAYDKTMVASYSHLERDREGYVTYNDINIKNELVSNRAVDKDGKYFLWEESVYYNLINYLEASDFDKIDDNTYEYNGDLSTLPLSIVHTAIPVSTFDIDYFNINIKDDKIDSFFFQEKETDEVYENCMYGRKLSIYFKDIDSTTIEKIKPYENNPLNESLKLALDELKNTSNFTIEAKAKYEDGQNKNLYETYVTNKDILQIQHSEDEDYYGGCHTYNDELYIFENTDDYLLGQKADTSINITTFLPTFDFSEDVFELIEEKDNYKIYKPYDSMSTVLDYIDVLVEHSEEYYAPSGDILFYVKNDHLEKIEFPVFTYTQEDPIIAIQSINYSNINSTTIDSSIWDNFVTEIPKDDKLNDWYEDKFITKVTNTQKELSLGEIFELCTNSKDSIPFFMEDAFNLEFDAEYSKSDKRVYIEMTFEVNDKSYRSYIIDLFISNNFETTISDELFEEFAKDDYIINFLFDGEQIIVIIDLPVGNILK